MVAHAVMDVQNGLPAQQNRAAQGSGTGTGTGRSGARAAGRGSGRVAASRVGVR